MFLTGKNLARVANEHSIASLRGGGPSLCIGIKRKPTMFLRPHFGELTELFRSLALVLLTVILNTTETVDIAL